MKVHDLQPAPGSARPRRHVGRGIAGKGGKTAGRGTKGDKARGQSKPGFEGGQLPLTQRIPKLKGFKNPFRVEYVVVNLETLEQLASSEVNPEVLREAGLVAKKGLVKVLGRGELTRRVNVSAHAFSASAAAAIQATGGSVEILPPPFGHGRRPPRATRSRVGSRELLGLGTENDFREHHDAGHRDTGVVRDRRYANTYQHPEPEKHVPDRGSAQQDHLHPVHHRRLPARRQHHRPGIDFNAVQSLASAANKGGVIAYLNLFSGGALTKMAVFGLGIMPYITSSIIIQLLMVVIPKFEQWREEGPSGQRKLTQVTRYMTIALAIMQSTGLAYAFHNGGGGLIGGTPLNVDLIPDFTVPRVLLIVLTLTGGTVVVMWLAELVTQRGIGQGMSVLIFTNVISGLPSQGDALLKSAGWPKFSFLVALALFFLVMIVFVELCQRRIPVTFAKRVVGRRMYGGQSTYIPMKLNTGGVVPIIFAASVLYFPILISNVFPSTGWGKDVQTWISTHLAQPSNLVYVFLYGGLILVFAYF